MRHRRVRALVGATAVSALLLAGCSGGGGDEPAPTGTSGTVTSTPRPTGTATEVDGAPLGSKFDWGRLDLTEDYVADLGGGSTFYELVWCEIAGGGQPDWEATDRIADRATQLGIQLMLKIRTGSCDLTEGDAQFTRGNRNKTESGVPKDLAAYRSFVTAAVQRYSGKGVHTWAVENEVNSPSFWAGTPEQLRELTTAAAEAVRAADAEAVVVDNGLSSTSYGYGIADRLLEEGKDQEAVDAWNTYFARRMGTRGQQIVQASSAADVRTALESEQGRRNLTYLDAIASMAEDGVVDVRQVHFYEDAAAVPLLLDYLRATTPADVPMEAWEVGFFVRGQQADESERVNDLVRKVSLLLGGGMRKVLWLPLIPNPDGRNSDEPRVGLIDPDGTVRESGTAFSQMAVDAADATVTPVAQDGVTGVALAKDGTTTAYLWADGSAVPLKAGAKAAAAGDTGDAVTSVTDAPVRVQAKGGLDGVLP